MTALPTLHQVSFPAGNEIVWPVVIQLVGIRDEKGTMQMYVLPSQEGERELLDVLDLEDEADVLAFCQRSACKVVNTKPSVPSGVKHNFSMQLPLTSGPPPVQCPTRDGTVRCAAEQALSKYQRKLSKHLRGGR